MKQNRSIFYGLIPTLFTIINASNSYAGVANIGGCTLFPANNVWNTPINTLPVHPNSNAWVSSIGANTGLHMDFASGKWENKSIGIPYNVIKASQEAKLLFNFLYNDGSDRGPYPINSSFKIEEGTDRHLITLDTETCKLYEIFHLRNENGWQADSGAIFDLKSNALRPLGWTSADAAGLPILPGLVRYEEVEAGIIEHAIRFTVPATNSYIWPGRHLTSGAPGKLTNQPPMGARFRLKADYDISKFDPKLQVILKAMKTYGIINADNGSAWFVTGTPDHRWNDALLATMRQIKGSAFEAVDQSCLMVNRDSGEADLNKCAAVAKDRIVSNAAVIQAPPNIGGCDLFPSNSFWNTPIDALPVHAKSSNWVANIGAGTPIHMDFAAGKWEDKAIGIPYNVINASKEPKYSFNFLYQEDSDRGPYPIADNALIEEGSDRHLISLDKEECKLYEIFNARKTNGVWQGDSGAIFDLKSNAFRPLGLTSADAAGLAILPGLVRYDEVEAGAINHAIRFTAAKTMSYIWPGTHLTSSVPGKLNDWQPPLGARFRMKSDFDISSYDPKLQVILKAMKKYGIILADNGSNWFFSGVTDSRWDDDLLRLLKRIRGNAFEAVDTSCMMISETSGQADLTKCGINVNVIKDRPVTPSCDFTLSMESKNFSAAGGIDSLTVAAAGTNAKTCDWTAKSNASWLPIYVQTLKGTKRVIFAVARNRTDAARIGTITVAGKTFSVNQGK